jgi:hypothetical protein
MAQVVVCLPSKHEDMTSNPSASKKKKKAILKISGSVLPLYGYATFCLSIPQLKCILVISVFRLWWIMLLQAFKNKFSIILVGKKCYFPWLMMGSFPLPFSNAFYIYSHGKVSVLTLSSFFTGLFDFMLLSYKRLNIVHIINRMAHACSQSSWEVEAGRSPMKLRHPGLHSKALCQKDQTK